MWTPNLRGVIRTTDDADILLTVHGQSVQEQTGRAERSSRGSNC